MLHVLFGPLSRQQGSKLKSLRVKYIAFAKDTGAWPLIPTKAANLFRYVLWLPQHGIQSGWKGVMNYVTAICNWNREMGFPDPREDVAFYWARLRHNFKRLVVVRHPAMKLPLRPEMLDAMALDADLSNDEDLRDTCMYFMLFFAGFRIGTVTDSPHALRFEDIAFLPELAQCDKVLICVRSSKTRPRAAGLPFWTAINRQPGLRFCPVELLQAHFIRAYRQRPDANLFQTAAGAPLPRRYFNTVLRRRLDVAQARFPAGVRFDLSRFSGISFRKGCLSTLGALNVPGHRLADHADHADVASSRIYTVDTVSQRAGNSDLIASAF